MPAFLLLWGCDDPAPSPPPASGPPARQTQEEPDPTPRSDPAADLAIEVVDPGGSPVAGATIVVIHPRPQAEWAVEFDASRYADFAGDPRMLRELMRRTGGLRSDVGRTDESGRLRFALTPDAISMPSLVTVTASFGGLTSAAVSPGDLATLRTDAEGGTVVLKLALRKLGEAEVRGMVTREGRPVAPAVVRLRDERGSLVAEAGVDSTGAYHLTGLPAGTFNLQVLDRGYVEEAGRVTLDPGAAIERELRISVSGRLTIVLGTGDGRSGGASEGDLLVGVDEPARYTMKIPGALGITGLPLDRLVRVRLSANGLGIDTDFTPSAERAEFRLIERLPTADVEAFRGTVTDPDGNRIAGAQVQLALVEPSEEAARLIEASHARPVELTGETDERGMFVFRSLIGGTYDATWYVNGFLQDVRTVRVAESEQPALVARHLKLDRALAGRVEIVDESGNAASAGRTGLTIVTIEKEGEHRAIARKFASTEADGTFRVEGLAPLRYVVMAGLERGAVVIPDALGEYEFADLRDRRQVDGVVVRVYPGPVVYGYLGGEGVEVQMADLSVRTGPSGLFVFTGVAAGSYEVFADAPGGTLRQRVVLEEGSRSARVVFE